MAESDLPISTKQRSTLNIEHGDLQLKLTNLQPNICDFERRVGVDVMPPQQQKEHVESISA